MHRSPGSARQRAIALLLSAPSQRFQVRLALDDPGAAPLRVGTTCTVTTIADPASPIMPLTRLIHRFVALWYYF